MTRDDILRLAQKAGFPGWWLTPPEPERQHGESLEMLERFAAMVAAAERAACAEHYLAVMRKAIEEEREQCAKLCEKQKSNWNYCAAAIRARSNT